MTDDTARAENYAADRCVDCGELTTNRIHHEERLSAYHDANVSLAPARPSGLLREALKAVLPRHFVTRTVSDEHYAAIANELADALAADEPGLDVERLAEALMIPWPESIDGYGYSTIRWTRLLAEKVAAEYARLSGRKP